MYIYPNYLSHYGVLGMKWGQRRARRYAVKSKEQAHIANIINKDIAKAKASSDPKISNSKWIEPNQKMANRASAKAKKYAAKSKKIEKYHKDMVGEKVYNRVKNQSTAKLVGKAAILGTYGTLKYEQAVASGRSKGSGVLEAFVGETVNSLTYGGYSVAEPRASRDRRNSKK